MEDTDKDNNVEIQNKIETDDNQILSKSLPFDSNINSSSRLSFNSNINNSSRLSEGPLMKKSGLRGPLVHMGEQEQTTEFDKPNPWTKVVVLPQEEFPYLFYIKINIPSLNDFENWKQVVPNIDFDPKTGELIIPSKDEASALALANLILINFSGQMSLDNILEKNLIQISITKAKSYEMVQNKLREQIMENLYGKQFNSVSPNYHQDLSRKNSNNQTASQKPGRVDFKDNSFSDTFQHYSDDNTRDPNNIEAFDGCDFAYL